MTKTHQIKKMADLLESRGIPRVKAHALWSQGVNLDKLVTLEPHEISRLIYERKQERDARVTYRVVYLVRGRRAWLAGNFTLDEAKREILSLKRRGFTAWVVDDEGRFIPVPGAKREPSWLP